MAPPTLAKTARQWRNCHSTEALAKDPGRGASGLAQRSSLCEPPRGRLLPFGGWLPDAMAKYHADNKRLSSAILGGRIAPVLSARVRRPQPSDLDVEIPMGPVRIAPSLLRLLPLAAVLLVLAPASPAQTASVSGR